MIKELGYEPGIGRAIEGEGVKRFKKEPMFRWVTYHQREHMNWARGAATKLDIQEASQQVTLANTVSVA